MMLALLLLLSALTLIDARTLRSCGGVQVQPEAWLYYRRARTIAWAIGCAIAWLLFLAGLQ